MYEYFNNHLEFLKKVPSVPRQSRSDGIARKSLSVAMHKFRKLTLKKLKIKASCNSLCV